MITLLNFASPMQYFARKTEKQQLFQFFQYSSALFMQYFAMLCIRGFRKWALGGIWQRVAIFSLRSGAVLIYVLKDIWHIANVGEVDPFPTRKLEGGN